MKDNYIKLQYTLTFTNLSRGSTPIRAIVFYKKVEFSTYYATFD